MAQKRRGLGRGLEALIPDAQKEKASASRPSDVFFPESREAEIHNGGEKVHVDSAPDTDAAQEGRNTHDLTAALLAPSQRKRVSKTRSTSSKTTGKNKRTTSVSRETAAESAGRTRASKTKDGKATSAGTSTKHGRSTSTVTQKRSSKKASEETQRSSEAAEKAKADELRPQSETVEAAPMATETSASDDVDAVDNAGGEPASQSMDTSEDLPVSRETAEKQSSSEESEPSPSEAVRTGTEPAEPEAHVDEHATTHDDLDAAESDGPDLVPVPGAHFAEIPVGLIHPNPRQPRQVFDEEDIAELAASIAEVGLLQPIVVREVHTAEGEDPRYELIMGERRLRASKEAGLEKIPAVVRDTDDVDMLRDALLENLHRVQLNPLEEAAAYQQLLEDFQCTHAELSERIARSRSQISNTLRLMKLPPLVQRRLAANVISAGHARALLGLPNAAEMERLAQRVVAEGLSVRATEELVALHEESDPGSDQPRVLRARSTPLPALSTRLSDAFDTRVKVTRGAKKGRITIEFAGDEDLARIVGALAPGTSLDEE